MKRTAIILTLLLLLSITFLAKAQWQLDKDHSFVNFRVEHIVVLKKVQDTEGQFTLGATQGTFNDFTVTFQPGGKDFSESKIEVVIQVNSIDTENETRDTHLRSADFFDAAQYPTMTFKSNSFEKTGDNSYKISGDFTMHGVTKTVEFDAQLNSDPTMQENKNYISFTTTGMVNRRDYGLSWNEVLENGGFRISNYVDFTIQANFIKSQ